MKRIYISGPMTGRIDLNFPAFHAEAARLRALAKMRPDAVWTGD